MAEYDRLPLHRMITVRNGIDVDEFVRADTFGAKSNDGLRKVIIRDAARLAQMKGLEDLLEAFAQLQSQGIRCANGRIAGGGSLRPKLEQMAGSLGIGSTVTFLGQVNDTASVDHGLDVFVLPLCPKKGCRFRCSRQWQAAFRLSRPPWVESLRLSGTESKDFWCNRETCLP